MIGSPAHPSRVFHRFLDWVGFSPRMRQRAFAQIERDLDTNWSNLDVAVWGPSLGVPLLLIHDAADREIAYQESADAAAVVPGARLITTRGLGHRRILDDAEVVRAVVGFVTQADVAAQVS
jgi:pimeloyl-ACP methyl ester carboxylesterase